MVGWRASDARPELPRADGRRSGRAWVGTGVGRHGRGSGRAWIGSGRVQVGSGSGRVWQASGVAHFYLAEDLRDAGGPVEEGGMAVLTGSEARHAATVSRTRPGERLTVGDGVGTVVRGVVSSAEAARVEIRVESVARTPRPTPAIRLVQALAKGDRDEAAVQAAVELGVDGVVPWAASRSIVRWQGARADRGRERWSAVAREATKQSMRGWLPDVAPVTTTAALARREDGARMLVLDPAADAALTAVRPDGRDIVVVVGPEGGIAPDELDALAAGGAERVRLGATVLRTSTAGPAAIAVLSAALGRW